MARSIILLRQHRKGIATKDAEFLKGYALGSRYYVTTCHHILISDLSLYEFIVSTIISIRHSGRWNAGMVVGWIAALLDQHSDDNEETPSILATSLMPLSSEDSQC